MNFRLREVVTIATPSPADMMPTQIVSSGTFNGAWSDSARFRVWGPSCTACSQLTGASVGEALFGTVRYTVRFNWAGYGGYTLMQEFTDLQEGVEVMSKRAFDTKGQEWMSENVPITTGPFEVQKWPQGEEIRLIAAPDHWRKTSYIARVSILSVGEATTRRAMLESGQAHAAHIGLNDMPALINMGFKLAPEIIQGQVNMAFGGDYDDPLYLSNPGRWEIPFDPDKANALLDEAGYSGCEGLKPIVWTGPSGTGVQVWDTVGVMWQTELGCEVEFDRTDYYAQHRPGIVARTSVNIYSGCCPGMGIWPMEWSFTSHNYPGGFGVGIETPTHTRLYLGKQQAARPEDSLTLGLEQHDFNHSTQLFSGLVRFPDGVIYDPNTMYWEKMRPYQWGKIGGMRSFEYVRLVQ